MRSSAPGMSPEQIAIEDAAPMGAIAGMGEGKRVTGARGGVAIVADRPGSEPITSPYTEAANIAMMTSQVEISANASIRVFSMGSPGRRQQAGGKRHAQQLAEDQVDGERRQRCERQRQLPLRPQRGRGDVDHDRRGDDEAEA